MTNCALCVNKCVFVPTEGVSASASGDGRSEGMHTSLVSYGEYVGVRTAPRKL